MSDLQPVMKPRLNDPNVFPDDQVLKAELADAFKAFELWRESLKSDELVMEIEWRYYKDGGAWLCKATKRKNTVCWISVWEGCFKIGFYFMDKHAEEIKDLLIDPAVKAEFANSKASGKLRHLGFEVRDAGSLADVAATMKYKISVLK